MQRKPEKGNAPEGRSSEALIVKNQQMKEGFNVTDSTQTQTIEVAFYGATLVVTEHNQQPYVPMKPVVSGMGLAWEPQATKLRNNPRWGMTEIVIPSAGGQQGMSCLPLRKLPGWLATISPNKVRPELREKVIAFQNEADDVLWQAWQEKQPTAPAQRPYNPAIDYERISPAQAQDIKELVHQVVDSGVQTFGETWNRLHNKFRVNSYLELPATKYDEVCAYLRGKLPDGYANSVVFDTGAPMPPVLDLQRIHAAMQTSTQAGAQVQQAVFESVLAGNDEWKFGRWLLSFITDSKLAAPAVIQQVGHDEFVTSTRQLIDCINDPGFLLSNTELAGLAQACTNRLARRLGGGAAGSMAG